MKRTCTIAALLTTTTLFSQATLDQGMVAASGVQLSMYIVTAPGSATEPTDGANQTWDLSTVTLQPMGTLDFTQASNTPFAASYPAANWAWAQTVTGLGTDHIYLDIDAAGIEVLATGVPSDINDYADPQRILQFPMAFGQSLTDTYVDANGTTTITWTYSGHGTAITPIGTFTNVAKVVSDNDDLLLWNTSPLYPMVIDNGSNVLVFAPGNVGVTDVKMSPAVQVYPNPCTDRVFVHAGNGTHWSITDLQGRTVQAGRFGNTDLQHIDVSGLSTGSYMLVMEDGGARRSVRFSKQ